MVRTPLAVALVASLLTSIAAKADTVVVTWNQAALQEVRLSRLGPPVVARALAIAHTCMYDAWTSYDAKAIGSVVATPRRPSAEHTDANKAKAISFAAHRCLNNLFPAGSARLDAVMRGLGYDPLDTSTLTTTPQGIGNAAAHAVIANRRYDGSNQYGDLAAGAYADYTGYAPVNAPMPFCLPATTDTCNTNATDVNRWQPLTGDTGVVQRFVAPHWERVTPFALSSASQYDSRSDTVAGPKAQQSAALLQADMDEILAIASTLDPRKKLIVEYWADGPESELPPGHWSLFAQHVSRRDLNTIDKDVKMFFAMQNASFDAGIVAWHLKRKFDGVRPITVVRRLRGGQQVFAWGGPGMAIQMIDAGTWTPYNPGSNLTPSFPGWVSGHSTFSAASATVLRNFTGSDSFNFHTTIPANFGRVEPGVPVGPTVLTYPTFTAAVTDAGLSRLYAGIHFSDDNTVGQTLGNLAGQEAWAKAKFLFDGGLTLAGASSKNSPWSGNVSWTHTVGTQNDRLLLVGISLQYYNNTVNSVSYAGRALSRLGYAYNNNTRAELWYLKAPPAGTATVSANLSYWDDAVGGAMNIIGAHQTTPFGTLRWNTGSTSQACLTLANESAPLVASVLAASGDAGGVSTATSGHSMAWNGLSEAGWFIGSSDVYGTGMVGPGAPVANICETLRYGRNWSMLGVPLKPAR
ncbi:vanadium-dependent haloperoxidase [Ideonella sp. A 288]|uniref:vanadium-dependent haloperoxidase n=1 Tax=Ideonella sp. A 288 TaxID=1962181 RepID=UPI00118729F1|nr:vanadium-dependent haloperoxidase [Ideonella sp. A 288]